MKLFNILHKIFLTKSSHQFIFSVTPQIMITVLTRLHLTCQCYVFLLVEKDLALALDFRV